MLFSISVKTHRDKNIFQPNKIFVRNELFEKNN